MSNCFPEKCDSCIHNAVCHAVAECLNYTPDFVCDHYRAKFQPISEETLYQIMDAEFEHHDSFWVITPKGKKIEFIMKKEEL
jgi:hypothetical protein